MKSKKAKKSAYLTIRVTQDVMNEIKEMADADERTITNFVNVILNKMVRERKAQKQGEE